MRITVVIITYNCLELLIPALKSVSEQTRKPDYVYVVSNSTDNIFSKEQEICNEFGFDLFRNYRTTNNAGALNTGVEEIVKQQGVSEDIYFASLDDKDIWLPENLKELENGISISNSSKFIKLTTLLKDGAFNEGASETIESKNQIEKSEQKEFSIFTNEISFKNKGGYQFTIGFIAGSDAIATRVSKQIVEKISTDLILIIDNTPKGENLENAKKLLSDSQKRFKLVSYEEWNKNLINGYYGEYFGKFDDINSIPLGRTILHRHLFDETNQFENPVYWIIDDDIDFNAISTIKTDFDLFDLINENLNKTDAIIGVISNDPPIPLLSCIRTQLVDFVGSYGKNINEDKFSIHQKPDYYYDLSDLHSNHLEIPILKSGINEKHLHQIFSGKAVFRPALQRELKSEYKTITRRGANTIVLNRDVLRLYPVINLEVNDKFARRGDLTWALFNQVVSNKIIIEHTFCINHNRPMTSFKLEKELEKSAYDIIGYAFNKAIFQVIANIKQNDIIIESVDIFSKMLIENNFNELKEIYCTFLYRRKSRFLMNYYRIIGLTKDIFEKFDIGKEYYEQLKDETKIRLFEEVMQSAVSETHLKLFLQELKQIIEENKH